MTTKVRSTLEATSRLFGGTASIATEAKEALVELATLEDATWNAALEAAATLFDAEAASVEARYREAKAEPGGEDNFNLWNWYSSAKSSAENNAKQIRSLKRGQS